MKKKVLFLFPIIMLSCGKDAPQVVSQKFEELLYSGKIENAKKYATEPLGKKMEMAAGFGQNLTDPDFKYNFIRDSISGNKAWVWYSDHNKYEMRDRLVKINNKWLLDDKQKVEVVKAYYDALYNKKTIKVKIKPY